MLNQTSASLAVYANPDSQSYAWSNNQGSDTAQAGGTVNVTAINTVKLTVSGIFSFKVYRNSDGSQKDITAGVFMSYRMRINKCLRGADARIARGFF